jgi:hypothetical protein
MTQGWTCPVCGYVWAFWVAGCSNCNRPEHEKAHTSINTNLGHHGIDCGPGAIVFPTKTTEPEQDTFDQDDCRLCIQNKETPDTCTETTCEHYGQGEK